MSHDLLQDSRFHASLTAIDRDLADRTRQQGCACGGPLHQAHYPRKPRGSEAIEADDAWTRRFSFCCGRDGCRRRATPPSLRFAGRRVYAALAVAWACAQVSERVPGAQREVLQDAVGVSKRTLGRWMGWWRGLLTSMPWWALARARFMPPVDEGMLPASLLHRFGRPEGHAYEKLLMFLAPLSTRFVLAR